MPPRWSTGRGTGAGDVIGAAEPSRAPNAPVKMPESALAMGPRMNLRAASLARSASSEVTRSLNLSLPVFTNSADRVLGRLEGADEALADISADLARIAGVIRQRRRGPPASR